MLNANHRLTALLYKWLLSLNMQLLANCLLNTLYIHYTHQLVCGTVGKMSVSAFHEKPESNIHDSQNTTE